MTTTTNAAGPPKPCQHARLSGRAFADFGLALSFALMLVSGVVLYIAPSGRTANAADWSLLLLGRLDWEALHIATAVVFTAIVAWHIVLHLRIFRTLLAGTPVHPAGHRREALAALAVVAVVALTAFLAWPPASWLADGSSYFRHSYWSTGEAAFPGAGRGRRVR